MSKLSDRLLFYSSLFIDVSQIIQPCGNWFKLWITRVTEGNVVVITRENFLIYRANHAVRTLAKLLKEHIKTVTLIEMDDFYLPTLKCADYKRVDKQVLRPLNKNVSDGVTNYKDC